MELLDFRMMGCFAIASLLLQSIYCPCLSYEGFSCVHNLKNVWISERLQEGKLHTLLLLWKIQVRSVTEALILIGATAARAAYCLHCWICWRRLVVVVDRLLYKGNKWAGVQPYGESTLWIVVWRIRWWDNTPPEQKHYVLLCLAKWWGILS